MRNKGFTLVELLIVMSIIAVLVTLGVVSYRGAQIRTQDSAVRKSDLKQYQNALEVFASASDTLYPHYPSPVRASTVLCPNLNLEGCPEDPRPDTAGIYYMYVSNGLGGVGSATATDYVLWARFELVEEYWVVCSDGRSGNLPVSTPITTGTCPL